MANTNVSNMTELNTAIGASSPGDTITCLSSGSFTGRITRSNLTKAAPGITILPQNRQVPTVFSNTSGEGVFNFTNVNGITFDGLVFRASGSSGNFPTYGGRAIRFTNCTRITFTNCVFDHWDMNLDTKDMHNFTFSWCNILGYGMDCIRIYDNATDVLIEHNRIDEENVDKSRHNEAQRHTDGIQFSCNGTSPAALRVTIQDNIIRMYAGRAHAIFTGNARGRQNASIRHTDCIFRRNFIESGHLNGIGLEGQLNALVTGNLLRRFPGSGGGNPGINIYQTVTSCTINNNVVPIPINGMPGTNLNNPQYDIENNIISTTAFPVGWDDPDTGPYGGSITRPATMVASDWFIGDVVPDPAFTSPQRYTGVIYIPVGSVAYNHSGIRWSNNFTSEPQPCTPLSDLPDGTKRRRMDMIGSTDTGNTILPDETMSDIRCYWRETAAGELSLPSTNVRSFTFVDPADDPEVTSVVLDQANYVDNQLATVTYDYTPGSGTETTHVIEWLINGSVVSTETVTIADAENPVGVVNLTRLNLVKSRILASTQPQLTAYNAFNSYLADIIPGGSAQSVLNFLANPAANYSFATSGEVATSRNSFIENGKPLYAAALAYRLTGNTAYADKAVQILNAWRVAAPNMQGNDPDGHPGLHIGSHLAPCFMYAIDLMRGYESLESALEAFRLWWYDECVTWMETVINAKMSGAKSTWRLDNWVDAAINGLLQTSVAFGDEILRERMINLLTEYFVFDWSGSRYMQRPWGAGGATIWVVRDDVERSSGTEWQGAQYTGYGQSSTFQALQTALYCGTDFITPNQAVLAEIINTWVGWEFFNVPFVHPTKASPPFSRDIGNIVNTSIIEFGLRHFPSLLNSNTKSYATANRPLDDGMRNFFATLTDGELIV